MNKITLSISIGEDLKNEMFDVCEDLGWKHSVFIREAIKLLLAALEEDDNDSHGRA